MPRYDANENVVYFDMNIHSDLPLMIMMYASDQYGISDDVLNKFHEYIFDDVYDNIAEKICFAKYAISMIMGYDKEVEGGKEADEKMIKIKNLCNDLVTVLKDGAGVDVHSVTFVEI